MTHTRTKTYFLRSVGTKKNRVKTKGWTDGRTKEQMDGRVYATDCFTFPTTTLGNQPSVKWQ